MAGKKRKEQRHTGKCGPWCGGCGCVCHKLCQGCK